MGRFNGSGAKGSESLLKGIEIVRCNGYLEKDVGCDICLVKSVECVSVNMDASDGMIAGT